MFRFIFPVLLSLIIISNACNKKVSEDETSTPFPSGRLMGSPSSFTKEDLSDPSFQSALTEVLKQLEESNKCHSFQLVNVIDTTKQIVAGVKYSMKLELRPSFSGENEDDCSDDMYSSVNGNKIVEVSVVEQAWRDPKHIVNFNTNSHFNSGGTMIVTTEPNTWSVMTPEELEMPVFQKAIRRAIDKLDREVGKCFHYEFVEMVDGEKMFSTKLDYKWRMKVNKIYEYQRQECLGYCADDCSGTDIYSFKAFVNPAESETPQITEAKFEKRLSPSFADDYELGYN